MGPLSILKIRGTNPLTVVDGGRDLQRKAQDLDELIGKQVHAVQELEQDWKGKAANAARGQAYRNIEHQHRFHEIIDAMANAMIAGGQTLATLRDALLNWVSTVSQMFNVADDGVVTTRPPRTGGAWDNIAATFTKCTHNMIKAFMDQDQNLANSLKTIAGGNTPGNNPKPVPGFTPGIDPDGFNNGQIGFEQTMAGFGDPATGAGGVGVPNTNTDLSIMGMTPEGRLFTIQGDTGKGMNQDTKSGGPGTRPTREEGGGGNNNIIFWKMDDHGKWVVDEVVNDPFKPLKRSDGSDVDISTIPTSTFNANGKMYASVMNVNHWNGAPETRPRGESGWVTRSSELWVSGDGGKTWEKTGAEWANDNLNNPFQVQSFAPSQDGKYVYMYGTQDGRTNDGLHAARVLAGSVGNPNEYEYWNGTSFSPPGLDPNASPPLIKTPPGISGIGEPSVHFYENKVLLTFNDESGGIYTSSSSAADGSTGWTPTTKVVDQDGAYGAFQSPFSGGDSIDSTLSLWNRYGTALYQIENSDTKNLGAY
ncbi:hypothetical protein MPHO_28010 [Mycolicibacterium phocaicum]|uniref:Uncharacterized protein n=1 Tax=Mycolicibacterium phocaicum TaxID=319706 RepID=A0A7I7ZQ21_9MYCO|nr:hypothetical protein C1S79_04065 [Mycolicibacterium phocaicum]BBZ55809.1 hypothetical protein MPHO_28010 [Mycolicibacterium phocaicum]